MHLDTASLQKKKKDFIIMTFDFGGYDCNTQEMVILVMQILARPGVSRVQYGVREKSVFRPAKDSKENLPLSLY